MVSAKTRARRTGIVAEGTGPRTAEPTIPFAA
jgi:hypothetical protein